MKTLTLKYMALLMTTAFIFGCVSIERPLAQPAQKTLKKPTAKKSGKLTPEKPIEKNILTVLAEIRLICQSKIQSNMGKSPKAAGLICDCHQGRIKNQVSLRDAQLLLKRYKGELSDKILESEGHAALFELDEAAMDTCLGNEP